MLEPTSESLNIYSHQSSISEPVSSNQQSLSTNSNQDFSYINLESALNKIHQAIRGKKLQGKLPLTVKIGKSVVFKAVSGQEPTVNKITKEQISLLQKVWEDPGGIQGSLRIIGLYRPNYA